MIPYDKVFKYYQDGLNNKQIAKAVGCECHTVSKILKEHGVIRSIQAPKRSLEERTFVCQHCGKTFINKRDRVGEGEKYCSRKCFFAHIDEQKQERIANTPQPIKTCPVCGKEFISSMSHICSDECRKQLARDKANAYTIKKNNELPLRKVNCFECGKEFEYHSEFEGTRKYCSTRCLHKATSRNNKHKRRQYINNSYKETISMAVVMKRAHGKCEICGCKVHKHKGSQFGYDPTGATLDHIIPLSKGGTHTYDNIQLACSRCNSIKSDSLEGVQLQLFGGYCAK